MQRREFLMNAGYAAVSMTALGGGMGAALRAFADDAGIAPEALQALRVALDGGTFLVPVDRDFSAKTAVYNARQTAKPSLIVLCENKQHVASAIGWVREYKVPFFIRGAGNSFEGLSSGAGAILDCSRMNTIEVDPEAATAWIDAGARLGDIYAELAKHDLTLPAGTCTPVSIAGLALGGGHGNLARKWGLTCDHLLEAEIVTADGDVLTANGLEHSDLFWALRGGGNANFGVVTRLIFKLRPIPPVLRYRFIYKTKDAWKAFEAWQNFAPNAPDAFCSVFHLHAGAGGVTAARAVGQFAGTQAEFQAAIKKWTAIAAPDQSTVVPLGFMDSIRYFNGGDLDTGYKPINFKASSDYIFEEKKLNREGFETLVKALGATGNIALCDGYGGAIARTRNSETAFPHRKGALYCIQYYSEWADAKSNTAKVEGMRQVRQKMAPYVSGANYANYVDLDIPDAMRAYYGTNLPRLERIKAKYDPENLFEHPQGIAPKADSRHSLRLISPASSRFKDPVDVEFGLEGDILRIHFDVENSSPDLSAGPAVADKPTPELYNFEIVEVFLSVGGDNDYPYYEFELSPRNEFLQVKITKAGERVRFDEAFQSEFEHSASMDETGWRGDMAIPLKALGWNGDPATIRGNAFAILGRSPRTFWGLFLPRQSKPDFHKPQYFDRLIDPVDA